MRFKVKNGFLETRHCDRVSQYKLPSRATLLTCLLASIAVLHVAFPTISSLFAQGLAGGGAGRFKSAVTLASNALTTEVGNILARQHAPLESDLPTLQLQIEDNTLQEMHAAIQHGDPVLNHADGGTKPYFNATLELNGKTSEVKICFRGTMHWHHRAGKPSFRVKLRKEDTGQHDRYIELTTLEDTLGLNNLLPMRVASKLGLMDDGSQHVRLFVNNKFFGVYISSNRQGEPFALANNRMPGTFFKAEFSEDMWRSGDAWKLYGEQDPRDVVLFQRWIELLQQAPSEETLAEFRSIFDTQKFAKWAALMAVVGSIHTDDRHNHSYFFSSNQGKIEPLVWDANAYGLHLQPDSPVDVLVQPVTRFLTCDPSWVQERNRWIRFLIDGPASLEAMTNEVDHLLERMEKDLAADRNLGKLQKFTGLGWKWIPSSVADLRYERDKLLGWIAERNRFLDAYLSDCGVRKLASGQICVVGNVAVNCVRKNGQTQKLYPGLSAEPELHVSDSQQAPIYVRYATSLPAVYDLPGPHAEWSFTSAIDGSPLELLEAESTFSTLLHTPSRTLLLKEPSTNLQASEIVLGPGVVHLEDDLRISESQLLTVKAGTTLLLDAGVGIYSRGRVAFLGTEEEPIEVARAGEHPWGTIGVSGPSSRDSIFQWCHIADGSTGSLDGLRFKGMLSVYDCPAIALESCSIGRNFVGDDAVNLAESNILVKNCKWEDSLADALDLDFCRGQVTSCFWDNSGNDALDMMACDVTVHDLEIIGSGDKGISVGENSRLTAFDVRIANCAIGVELKDDSVACISDSRIQGCQMGVHAYQKKWFYLGGGNVALVRCQILDSVERDLRMRERCSAVLVETAIDTPPNSRVSVVEKLPAEWNHRMLPARYGALFSSSDPTHDLMGAN